MNSRLQISADDKATFDREGFLMVSQLLSPPEVQLLEQIARRDREIESGATARSDAAGGQTVLAVRDHLSDDMFSAIARCQRVAGSMQSLMGEEIYHYHHKLMLKEPRVGGAWEWHQDYGYWYNYGCLFPRMASCYIAIDRAGRDNGCLQVIPQSQQLGRLEHGKVGGQTGADEARVDQILKRLPLLHVEMQPGDALFFHGNLLHRSDQNRSEHSRWSLICCYNARSNNPYEVLRHNGYQRLEIIDDDDVITAGTNQWNALTET
ncbi:Phytanoyl-CoA dioxygenase (PhyH) [Rosistilla carotiformis]|uniref:Phytanoyl-CoA dioxygenase (PhyH) n=1 Tax=Rosistilla carotiformis TaxID=2528017 RepID=A0A518K0Z7_9BACT|nr:phytanoyl-CoA dioxygenase family protein [Rosistilla carotiformis]QDV71457.1 Phytanoyl-CoA dioxygenase (PhyH) [Rosistilla carotiformis]